MSGKYNQLSRYGAIAKMLPMTTGKVFFLVSSSEAALNNFQDQFPVDADGRVRVFTAWADAITEIQQVNDSSVLVISPLFTTVPTAAQIEALKAAKCVTVQAGNILPDGSYLATKAAFALSSATTIDLFQVNARAELMDILAEVVTTVGATASGAKFMVAPTVGSTTDICATTNIANAAVGSTMTITGTLTAALVVTTQGAVSRPSTPIVMKAGKIQLNTTQTTTGNLKVFVRYKALEPGGFVSPL